MYLRGCKTIFLFFFFFFSFLNSECKSQRVLFKGVTHYKECTFYISISHWLHHRVYVSSASLPLLFKISGKKHLPSHFLKICVQSTNIFKHRRIYKSIYVLCHRYNVKYDVFYAKVLQCPPLHSVDAGCLAVEQLGGRQQQRQQQPPSPTVDLLVYITADPSPGDVLHEKSPGTDLIGQGKILWIICVLFLSVCFFFFYLFFLS